MSVIVTGMDVPKSCEECHYNNSSCWCSITNSGIDREFEYRERLDDCPLKSIDELIEKITQLPTEENAEGQDMFQAYDVLRTIKEYCEVSK